MSKLADCHFLSFAARAVAIQAPTSRADLTTASRSVACQADPSMTVTDASPRKTFSRLPGFFDRKHNYRKSIVASKGDGRPVHHFEIAGQNLRIGQPVEALGVGVLLAGRHRIDAIDLRRLGHGIAIHLDGAQRRGRVGREKRVAGAGGKDDDAARLDVMQGLGADVALAHRRHRDGRQHARRDASACSSAICSASAFITVASMPM